MWLQLSICSLPDISSLLQKTFVTMLPLGVAIPMSHNPTSHCKAALSFQAKQSNTNHGLSLSDILHLPFRQRLSLQAWVQQRKHPNIRCAAGQQEALWSLQADTSCSDICRRRLPRLQLSRLRPSGICRLRLSRYWHSCVGVTRLRLLRLGRRLSRV
jgi:hypothetical protein